MMIFKYNETYGLISSRLSGISIIQNLLSLSIIWYFLFTNIFENKTLQNCYRELFFTGLRVTIYSIVSIFIRNRIVLIKSNLIVTFKSFIDILFIKCIHNLTSILYSFFLFIFMYNYFFS